MVYFYFLFLLRAASSPVLYPQFFTSMLCCHILFEYNCLLFSIHRLNGLLIVEDLLSFFLGSLVRLLLFFLWSHLDFALSSLFSSRFHKCNTIYVRNLLLYELNDKEYTVLFHNRSLILVRHGWAVALSIRVPLTRRIHYSTIGLPVTFAII